MDTNNIPADFAFGFSQSNPNASNDDMVAAWQQKNPTPDPTPDPINEGVDPAANAGDPPADGSADPQANPAPAYDFS